MRMGLRITLATFQGVMDVIVSAVKWQYAVVYLDDFVIISSTPEVRIKRTEMVLRLLKDVVVALKL